MPPFLFHVKHFDKCFMWIFLFHVEHRRSVIIVPQASYYIGRIFNMKSTVLKEG